MRVAPAAAGVLFLLSLLAWLSGLNSNSARFDRELQALDDFGRFERGLIREVLTARTGLSRNYDALVRMTDAYDKALDRLQEVADEGPDERAATEALDARAHRQQELVGAKPEQLAEVEISGRGSAIYFPQLDASIYIPGLLQGLTGTKRWMAQQLGRQGGKAKSAVKGSGRRYARRPKASMNSVSCARGRC